MSYQDNCLLWALEHLAVSPSVPYSVLHQLIGQVRFNNTHETLPAPLQYRLLLCGLLHSQQISPEMLNSLIGMVEVVTSNVTDFDPSAIPHLLAPAELYLQVKTELVARSWRDNLAATPDDIIRKVQEIFIEPVASYEVNRRDELLQAAVNPTYRINIDRMIEDNSALLGIHRFARNASQALGPTLLQIINDDMNKGRYFPGSNFMQDLVPVNIIQNGYAARPPSYTSPLMPSNIAGPSQHHLPITTNTTPMNYMNTSHGNINNASAAKRKRVDDGNAAEALNNLQSSRKAMQAIGRDPLFDYVPRAASLRTEQPSTFTGGRAAAGGGGAGLVGGDEGDVDEEEDMPKAKITNGTLRHLTEKGRRKQNRWTRQEEDALIEGCRLYGPGRWAQILEHGGTLFSAQGRSSVDLKDKWRNLLKGKRAAAVEVQEQFDEKEAAEEEARKAEEEARKAEEEARQMENEGEEEEEEEEEE